MSHDGTRTSQEILVVKDQRMIILIPSQQLHQTYLYILAEGSK
jgi:hypothetical protein